MSSNTLRACQLLFRNQKRPGFLPSIHYVSFDSLAFAHRADCVRRTININPTPARFRTPSPRKQYPQPILCTRGAMMAAATAAPGLRNMLPRAKAPAACCARHNVKNEFEATNTHDIPNPAISVADQKQYSSVFGKHHSPRNVEIKVAAGWSVYCTKKPNIISPVEARRSPHI